VGQPPPSLKNLSFPHILCCLRYSGLADTVGGGCITVQPRTGPWNSTLGKPAKQRELGFDHSHGGKKSYLNIYCTSNYSCHSPRRGSHTQRPRICGMNSAADNYPKILRIRLQCCNIEAQIILPDTRCANVSGLRRVLSNNDAHRSGCHGVSPRRSMVGHLSSGVAGPPADHEGCPEYLIGGLL
jgi:hypothetical protein